MKKNGLKTYEAVEEYYIQRVVDMVKNLSRKSIVWQEVFQNGVQLANDTVVHVWLGNRWEHFQQSKILTFCYEIFSIS